MALFDDSDGCPKGQCNQRWGVGRMMAPKCESCDSNATSSESNATADMPQPKRPLIPGLNNILGNVPGQGGLANGIGSILEGGASLVDAFRRDPSAPETVIIQQPAPPDPNAGRGQQKGAMIFVGIVLLLMGMMWYKNQQPRG